MTKPDHAPQPPRYTGRQIFMTVFAIVPLGLLWAFCILVSYGGLRLIARSSRGSRG